MWNTDEQQKEIVLFKENVDYELSEEFAQAIMMDWATSNPYRIHLWNDGAITAEEVLLDWLNL